MIFGDPRCEVCDTVLTGRQQVVCSNACRQARKRARKLTSDEYQAKLLGRDCEHCGDAYEPKNDRQRFCSENCAYRAKAEAEETRWESVCELDGCENNAGWDGSGRARRYCSNAHRQKAYRQRKHATPL
ncbi:hypothetical protein GCM10018980_58430 [Streptomyces capoamus]|uniref:Uncharacterized protein n=1 Tax=Streptomyces capoamus TaxID=68183 RepID=A0A919F112_9ACTN|nr:hypothetical protein GCM10010501_48130 [Streptomyces libani subsp. rufus]GHG66222.1 hypothetical protein GCM10018980_58430 [Streptomyces capoamus]